MQPTIIGNSQAGILDRIVVNKLAYRSSEPERYDVAVFDFPLNRRQQHVSRIVGLGGERVVIRNGNIYSALPDENGNYGTPRVARKTQEVREAVLKRIYPSGKTGETYKCSFSAVKGSFEQEDSTIRLSADSLIRYTARQPICDNYLDGYDPRWGIAKPHMIIHEDIPVNDLVLRMEVEPATGCEAVELRIYAGGREHRAVLAVGTSLKSSVMHSGASSRDGAERAPVVWQSNTCRLEAGRRTPLELCHVDESVILEIAGQRASSYVYDHFDDYPRTDNAVEFGVVGGGCRVWDVEILRDIHYVGKGGKEQYYDIPNDMYFCLGDNTQNANDGRSWQGMVVSFQDGKRIVCERSPYLFAGNRIRGNKIVDCDGKAHLIDRSGELTIEAADDKYRFVPSENMIGKVMFVYWPPHRWKAIR